MTTITETKVLTEELAIQMLEKEYPSWVSLVYIDYNNSLNENPDVLNWILTWGECRDTLNENWWISDAEYESIAEIKKELFDGYEISDEVNDTINEWCREHNDSDPIKDLIRNTNSPLAVYDTWFYFEEADNTDDMYAQCLEACKHLGIHTKYARTLYNKIRIEAYYWWQLLILFNPDLIDFYNHKRDENPEAHLLFDSEIVIGVIHYGNGSWYFDPITLTPKSQIAVPLDSKRIQIDELEKYSIQNIFGCFRNVWSEVKIVHKKPNKNKTLLLKIDKIPEEDTTVNEARLKEQAEFNRIYREWKCSFTDSDISRHRWVFYKNEYPCWSHCPHCGRFRID